MEKLCSELSANVMLWKCTSCHNMPVNIICIIYSNIIYIHVSLSLYIYIITATLAKLFQGGVTYQNNFSEIILDFMRGPYTSDIGQTMQK